MSDSNLKQKMNAAKMVHLMRAELEAYRDGTLDKIEMVRAEAHLKSCLICEKSVELLRGELVASKAPEVSPDHLALIKRTLADEAPDPELIERLAEFLTQFVTNWRASFGQLRPVHRGGESGKEVWRFENEQSGLRAWAVLEKNSSLTIHLSSTELGLEGTRLKVGLGRFNRQVTLERFSDSASEVYAKIVVPKEKRPRKLEDISVEIIGNT